MNIALVHRDYPIGDGEAGGIGRYTAILARALHDQGHAVQVVTAREHLHRAGRGDAPVNGPVPLVGAGAEAPILRHRLLWKMERYAPINHFYFSRRVARTLSALDAGTPLDVVEIPVTLGQGHHYGRRARRAALVVRLHGCAYWAAAANRAERDPRVRLTHWLEMSTIRGADALTAPSPAIVDFLRPWTTLRDRPLAVIPNAVDTRVFRPGSGPTVPPFVLFAGRLSYVKGAHVLADAIDLLERRLPDLRVTFAGGGTGAYAASIRGRFANNPRIQFLGALGPTQLASLYRAAALTVLPSRIDNLPNVCIESLACGTAVVASRVGGIPTIVEDGREGLLVPPDDPLHLADALERLLVDPGLRTAMGQAGRRKVERLFSVDAVTARTVAFYEDVVGAKRGGPNGRRACGETRTTT